ncbi:CHAP domain-containing protein [Kitasatospora atroaurantiaca]|uniref:Putative peptidoglycan binding protein n=1 Tax=Kitasatospora atroaurantiaca TaxID=285545 RepID=A0A561ERX2_9ACTN|nr:LysM peptidoglycan-binding domain-containing protein [Kitasatospora atroaurantiaca]TWE18357.1 putative peptidoglycan binding protein [Kitasatospora atroaurantiaca]
MGTADAMINAAAGDLGYKEGPDNDTKFGEWYGLNYNPWCDMAQSRWGQDSGNADVVGHFAYCPSHVTWFRERGQWHGSDETARRGDLVFYSWHNNGVADHVGLVVEDSAPGAELHTIEGNTSSGDEGSQGNGDGVYRRVRGRGNVMGFGRPAYSGGSSGTYTVQPGDTLSEIGSRLGIRWQDIAAASGLSNPDVLSVGQVLTLPGGGGSPAPSGPAYPGALTRKGSKGSTVRQIQSALIDRGYGSYLAPWGADGSFGNATDSGVRAFQSDQGIDSDGIVGPVTWGRLFN